MSTDIVTNQISKDVVSSSTVAKTANVSQVQTRQNMAAEEGKSLPPEAEKTGKVSSDELQQAVTEINDRIVRRKAMQVGENGLLKGPEASGPPKTTI